MCGFDRSPHPSFGDRIRHDAFDDVGGHVICEVVVEANAQARRSRIDVNTQGAASMPHSFGAAVSDAGLKDDFDPLARRKFPVAALKQRVDKHTVETIELSRIKVSIDEHDVSNGDLTDIAETKIACTSLDRGRARVCLDRVKSETVPTGHWLRL